MIDRITKGIFGNRFLRDRDEEVASTLVHTFGLGIACAMTVALYWRGGQLSPTHTISGVIYGLAHVLTYAASVAYHYTSWPPLKSRLRVLDQSAIYAAIAGTYTPILCLGIPDLWNISLTIIVWTVCLCGILYKVSNRDHPEWGSLSTYISFATAGALLFILCDGGPICASREAFGLSFVCFALGLAFYIWHYKRHFHTVWHVLTLAGHIAHFYAVWTYFMRVV